MERIILLVFLLLVWCVFKAHLKRTHYIEDYKSDHRKTKAWKSNKKKLKGSYKPRKKHKKKRK